MIREREPRKATTATVLVVEDDPLVRLVVRDALEEIGLHVVEASDGEGGLLLLLQDETVVLLITDIAMPRMDGLALLAQARRVRPDLKAIVTSGHSSAPSGEAFIQKPYRVAALQDMVCQILGR